MRAKDVMSDGVMSIAADATVYEAIELLVNTRVSAMPVLDDAGIMIGIVSEADLIKYAAFASNPVASGLEQQLSDSGIADAAYKHLRSHKVTHVMTTKVAAVDENASLGEVATLMRQHGVKRLPVLRGKSVVGIVSRVNLLQALISRRAPGDLSKPAGNVVRPADEQLRLEVIAAVQGKSWSVARRTDVVVNGSVVHIWGVVPSNAVREAYRAAAATVHGVKAVETHMHIVPVG